MSRGVLHVQAARHTDVEQCRRSPKAEHKGRLAICSLTPLFAAFVGFDPFRIRSRIRHALFIYSSILSFIMFGDTIDTSRSVHGHRSVVNNTLKRSLGSSSLSEDIATDIRQDNDKGMPTSAVLRAMTDSMQTTIAHTIKSHEKQIERLKQAASALETAGGSWFHTTEMEEKWDEYMAHKGDYDAHQLGRLRDHENFVERTSKEPLRVSEGLGYRSE